MLSRPIDFSGDILPVRSPADILTGPAAAASGLRDHLNLFPGEWWEYEDRGNPVFDLISVSRRTARDADTLTAALTSYILSFPGIRSVTGAKSSFDNRLFSFSCTAHTESGETFPVHFAAP